MSRHIIDAPSAILSITSIPITTLTLPTTVVLVMPSPASPAPHQKNHEFRYSIMICTRQYLMPQEVRTFELSLRSQFQCYQHVSTSQDSNLGGDVLPRLQTHSTHILLCRKSKGSENGIQVDYAQTNYTKQPQTSTNTVSQQPHQHN